MQTIRISPTRIASCLNTLNCIDVWVVKAENAIIEPPTWHAPDHEVVICFVCEDQSSNLILC